MNPRTIAFLLYELRAAPPREHRRPRCRGDRYMAFANEPIKKLTSLRGRTVINLFFENSTRTRTSFELAAKRLSAEAVNISVSSSSVTKGETLLDTALT